MQNEHRLHFCMVFWARCSCLHGPGGHRFHNWWAAVGRTEAWCASSCSVSRPFAAWSASDASKGILSLHNDALQASKGLLTLHNDAHQASAGPLRPVNYEKRWPPGPCKMNIVFIFVWSFEHGVHFCMGRVVIVFIIDGRQWARRSLVCIIVWRQ